LRDNLHLCSTRCFSNLTLAAWHLSLVCLASQRAALNSSCEPKSSDSLLPDAPKPRKKKTAPAQFEVLKGSLNWAKERSTLTLEQLVNFNDLARSIAVTIVHMRYDQTLDCYSEVLRYIENSVVPLLRRYPGLLAEAEEGEEKWGTQLTLIRNIPRILPTEQGLELLNDFHERLKARAEQLKHPYVLVPKAKKGA
jgi:hypothetical protein